MNGCPPVWGRNVNETGRKLQLLSNVTESSCSEDYFLYPGVWNFAFALSALSAFNGDDESGIGPEVVAPFSKVLGGQGTGPKCLAPEPWCPGGGDVSVPPGEENPTRFPLSPAGTVKARTA